MSRRAVVIAGGGTGGHIYPGVAIARALQKLDPSVEIHFVGTAQGLESKIIPKEGFQLHLIESGQLNVKSPLKRLQTLLKIPKGILQSMRLLSQIKPLYVIGVGGYASGPFVLAASIVGFNTAIWEPNAMPGMANRFLSRFVDKCFVVFDEAKSYLKNKNVQKVGMPVREEIEKALRSPREDQDFHVLSFGGSQGAQTLNRVLSEALLTKTDWTQSLRVVHQLGRWDYMTYSERYKNSRVPVEPFEFIFDMPKYYGWADIIVSRGGASTIAEAAAYVIVPIIIPLPAADNHQQKNAEALVRQNAGVMILQKDLTPDRLVEEIQRLRDNKALREEMMRNIKGFYIPHSAMNIAKEILQ